jgi:hypothetical protein
LVSATRRKVVHWFCKLTRPCHISIHFASMTRFSFSECPRFSLHAGLSQKEVAEVLHVSPALHCTARPRPVHSGCLTKSSQPLAFLTNLYEMQKVNATEIVKGFAYIGSGYAAKVLQSSTSACYLCPARRHILCHEIICTKHLEEHLGRFVQRTRH